MGPATRDCVTGSIVGVTTAAMTKAGGEQHVILCVVEQGGHGSTTAAPIVRRIIEGLYGLPQTPFIGQSVPD